MFRNISNWMKRRRKKNVSFFPFYDHAFAAIDHLSESSPIHFQLFALSLSLTSLLFLLYCPVIDAASSSTIRIAQYTLVYWFLFEIDRLENVARDRKKSSLHICKIAFSLLCSVFMWCIHKGQGIQMWKVMQQKPIGILHSNEKEEEEEDEEKKKINEVIMTVTMIPTFSSSILLCIYIESEQ